MASTSAQEDFAYDAFLQLCCESLSENEAKSTEKEKKKWLCYIQRAVNLLEEELTVPFIARYRRTETNDISASSLYRISRNLKEFHLLMKEKVKAAKKLDRLEISSTTIRNRLQECVTVEELDSLMSQYKEYKTSKASTINSIEQISVLVKNILEGSTVEVKSNSIVIPSSANISFLEAIRYKIAEEVAQNSECKEIMRSKYSKAIVLRSTLIKKRDKIAELKKKGQNPHNFDAYNDFEKLLKDISSHQLLAIRRGKVISPSY
jgi:uncharacterized protein